jgi:hypothetical protein
MNFIMLQHSYHRRIIQQTSGEKPLHCWFIWRDGSDDEHIITAGWCKPAVVMYYHRRLVRRSGGDSYQFRCFLQPVVILSLPTASPTILMIPVVIETLVIGQSVLVFMSETRSSRATTQLEIMRDFVGETIMISISNQRSRARRGWELALARAAATSHNYK